MTDKRKLLDLAFNCNDKNAIQELTLDSGKILNERLRNPSPSEYEIAIGKLTSIELNDCLDYLCKETGRVRIDYSTWTNEQLEARLFELENKDHETN
jgi:hypothetical protein